MALLNDKTSSDSSIEFRRVVFGDISLFSFNNNFIWQADNRSAGTVHGLLLHAEMIRTVSICHTDLAILYLTYVGIAYLDHLVPRKRVRAVFLTIYRDTDRTIMSTPGKVHATPENQSKHHDTDDKSQFVFLQIKLPHFYKRGNFSINNTNIIIAYA